MAQGDYVPPPPPAPSARQANPQYPAPLDAQGAPLPSFEHGSVEATAEMIEATPLESDENPFQTRSRWKQWLKKPSRELSIRAGIAALALTVGWGVGATPWKGSSPTRTVAAAKAAPAKKPAAKAASAKATAVKAALAARPAPAAAPPVRRVAAVNIAASPASKARAATKPASAAQKKSLAPKTATKSATKTATNAKAKASALKSKAVAKAAKTKVKAKAKATAKTSANQKG
ncbi:MAG TPA: hypothetical protein VEX18_10240 [Polyangiaceae bacterium]|nr:hypothetical protein [Polyangiaceae bacterium]